MYKQILVTLDGSKASEAVLGEVARVSGRKTSITLLRVADEPEGTAEAPRPFVVAGAPAAGAVTRVPPPRTFEDRVQATARVTDELTEYLDANAKPLREQGLGVTTLVRFGSAAEEILTAAADSHADLIVMATHGRTGLSKVIFGSVAGKIVASGAAPVLLVRPGTLA